MKITFDDIRHMVKESINHIISEGWKPIYRRAADGELEWDGDEWDGNDDEEEPDDDALERERIINDHDYMTYVVINDSDGSLIGTYKAYGDDDGSEAYEDAVKDAKEQSLKNHNGTYSVFGCIDGKYDDDTLVATF